MRSHPSTLISRMIRAGLKSTLRYRVVAVGLDSRNHPIILRTNTPRLVRRGWHAEERVIHNSPPTLKTILLARIGADGRFLPIDACKHCAKLARKRGIKIQKI